MFLYIYIYRILIPLKALTLFFFPLYVRLRLSTQIFLKTKEYQQVKKNVYQQQDIPTTPQANDLITSFFLSFYLVSDIYFRL